MRLLKIKCTEQQKCLQSLEKTTRSQQGNNIAILYQSFTNEPLQVSEIHSLD